MVYRSCHQSDRKLSQAIIQGYATWVSSYVDKGWDPYILSFMFQQVPGSRASVLKQMKSEVERVYAISLTRVIRKPKCDAEQGKLPIWLACPDLPVPKRQNTASVTSSSMMVFIIKGLHLSRQDLAWRAGWMSIFVIIKHYMSAGITISLGFVLTQSLAILIT
jgi:hypothetical protein